jgi:hypothetical protein
MHKFERLGRTSDRGTPIHPYRTTHITHTHGDFLGSTSLPRLFSHSYGLLGLRLIVFLFYLLHLLLDFFFLNIYQSGGNGSLEDQLHADWTELDWTGRTDIYIDIRQYDLSSRHLSNEGLPTWSRAVWVLYSGVCTAFLDFFLVLLSTSDSLRYLT